MILLITYDLRRPGQDYSGLHNEIKADGYWWHHLESTWIIKTNNSPESWYHRLSTHLDQNDFIFITEIKPNYWGFLPQSAWDWLSDRFREEGFV